MLCTITIFCDFFRKPQKKQYYDPCLQRKTKAKNRDFCQINRPEKWRNQNIGSRLPYRRSLGCLATVEGSFRSPRALSKPDDQFPLFRKGVNLYESVSPEFFGKTFR
jgi:hypothetical protein